MSVFAIQRQSYAAFTGGDAGFDAVLGARGSQLRLVLNTVFHLETSPGNIPFSMYEEIKKNPQVELVIPYTVGKSARSFLRFAPHRLIIRDERSGGEDFF